MKLEDDDYEGHGSDAEFRDNDDEEVLKKSTHPLGLAKDYAPQWLPRDAFRELYQNWKDGIVESFGVLPHYIRPTFVRNDDKEIHIIVTSSAVGLLGYIRFQSKQGILELTNLKAKLDRKHLDLGETSKRDNNALAGGHGEGFKLAALVMRRNGYSVRFETNSFCWNFSFQGTRPRLYCLLNKPGAKLLREQRSSYRRGQAAGDVQRGLTSYIWEDMTVKIGKSRDREGAQKVSEEDFRAWMKVSIDLDPPESSQIVRTWRGDLIFDPRFRDRIYLHGLLVSESAGYSQGGRAYRFGYNFHQGKFNRDRQRMTDEHEEAKALANIWEQAIVLKGDSVIDAYIKLFAEDEEAADIVQAYQYTTPLTAQNLCTRLKESHPEAFFYSERCAWEQNASTDEDIISKELKRQPAKLGKKIWWVLRRHEPPLMRTPLEERNHLFETSELVQPGKDMFSLNIIHALKGSFALNAELSRVKIEFLDGADTAIDLLYSADRNLLQIHAKWLDVAQVHQVSSCEFFKVAGEQMESDSPFFCDHVIQDLLEAAFEEVRVPLNLAPATAACLRRNAVEYLRKMPRAIKMTVLDAGKKLKVKWAGNESGVFTARYGPYIHYWVTLHEEISQTRSEVIFDGLDPDEVYFPMVSRAERPSFSGLPTPSSDQLLSPLSPRSPALSSLYGPALSPGFYPRLNPDSDLEMDLELGLESNSNHDKPGEDSDSDENFQIKARGSKASARSKVVALERTRWQKDEQDWLEWYQQHRPDAQSRAVPSPQQTLRVDDDAIPPLRSLDRNLSLEIHHYYRVLLEGEEREQVIFVHRVIPNSIGAEFSYSLLVTRYSMLSSVFPPQKPQTTGTSGSDDQELILHFCDFDKMRTALDAETIPLNDILSACRVGTSRNCVSHGFRHRPDIDTERLFCRFGISKAGADGRVTTITPLASHHFLHDDYDWEPRSFRGEVSPVAFDLTPSVLGVSEGFASRGFTVQAAFGLDEARHNTWMNRHLVAQYFDGPILDVFKDFDSGNLLPIQLPAPAAPKVLLFASEHACFRLNVHNSQMPTLRQFLKPLDAVDKAVEVLKPDFVVMLLPPAFQHPSAMPRHSSTLFRLVEMGFSVHSTLIALTEYGVPQERSILAVIASPFGVPLSWKFDQYAAGSPLPATIGNLIGDLNFKNPRIGNASNTGFVCKPPPISGSDAGTSTLDHVYNHYTGICAAPGAQTISMDSQTLSTFNGPKQWIHPVRNDRLTVREYARIQGIPDELRFFGTKEEQYETVCKAVPPIVAKMIAHTVREAINQSRVVAISAGEGNTRRKRVRFEVEE
ncbi:hypothetical protein AYO22_02396 [Fonsecaea multimorphosa]|nr:hypothetical protein AYO22_02396 [Fonsecaea multimorphosa]